MKKILFGCLCFLLLFWKSFANDFTKTTLDGVTFQYITFHPEDELYKLDFVISEKAQTLDDILLQNNGISWLNGIFFCPEDYTACKWENFTINERIVDGVDYSAYSDTWERAIFAWDKEYNTLLFKTNSINSEYRNLIYEGMWNYPILLHNGESMIPYYSEIWLIDSKMASGLLGRHFICNTKDSKDIIFGKTSAISLENLAPILTKIGCYNALNLDAGLSTYFNYNGRNIESWSRKVLDALVISSPSIDVQEINTRLDSVVENYFWNLRNIGTVKARKTLDVYISTFNSARIEMYNANSQDIFNESGKNIGYNIHISDPEILKRVYIINSFQRKLETLKKSLDY